MQGRAAKTAMAGAAVLLLLGAIGFAASYEDEETPDERTYAIAPPAHRGETRAQADDDLYRQVCAAYEAVNNLRMKTHYLSCGGVGAPAGFGK